MKHNITLYYYNDEFHKDLDREYEGKYFNIDFDIEYFPQIEECHGVHDVGSYEISSFRILLCKIDFDVYEFEADVTDILESIFFDKISDLDISKFI